MEAPAEGSRSPGDRREACFDMMFYRRTFSGLFGQNPRDEDRWMLVQLVMAAMTGSVRQIFFVAV